MSHELRTPLAIILGHLGIVQDRTFSDLNTAQAGAAGMVEKHSREFFALANSILQATLVEADQVVVEFQLLNLAEPLAGLKTNYEAPLEKPVDPMWHYPPDLPIINADKKNLLRILQNLFDNAIKFTSEGEVSISARTNPENDSVEFVLADRGSRIAEEDRTAILREVSIARQFRNEGVRRAWSGPVYRQEICSANGRGYCCGEWNRAVVRRMPLSFLLPATTDTRPPIRIHGSSQRPDGTHQR